MWWWPGRFWWLKHFVGCFSFCCFNFYPTRSTLFPFLKNGNEFGYLHFHSHSRSQKLEIGWAIPLPVVKVQKSFLDITIQLQLQLLLLTRVSSLWLSSFLEWNGKLNDTITIPSKAGEKELEVKGDHMLQLLLLHLPSFRILPLAGTSAFLISIKRPDGPAQHKGMANCTFCIINENTVVLMDDVIQLETSSKLR